MYKKYDIKELNLTFFKVQKILRKKLLCIRIGGHYPTWRLVVMISSGSH